MSNGLEPLVTYLMCLSLVKNKSCYFKVNLLLLQVLSQSEHYNPLTMSVNDTYAIEFFVL